ncbi:MAG TPA: glycosyltransferase family 1 protein [Gemmatimonadaceae bacterium]|nr:glycosyltransferase family 1 protein [Gemmatimonadaceae bacterium]
MLTSSGIGTYLQNLLPRVIHSRPQYRFHLLGDPTVLDQVAWSRNDNTSVGRCTAPIYSIAEQVQLTRTTPRETDLFWAPHYNIPLHVPGRLMVTVHDLSHVAMPEFVRGVHRRLYARFMFTALRLRAHAVITDSNFTAAEFTRLVGTVAPSPYPIHLGIAESWFRVCPTCRPHSAPYLLFVGNVKPHKNLVALLQALDSITHVIPHDLVIVGKREGFITGDRAAITWAERLGERVRFTGAIPIEQLEQFMVFADALVLPSLYEGFGLPPLEAMACGCPTIVSTAASLPEVCGDAALYIDPRNPHDIATKIVRLLDDDELRAEFRRKGTTRAASFSWDRCAVQTLAVMDNLLAR